MPRAFPVNTGTVGTGAFMASPSVNSRIPVQPGLRFRRAGPQASAVTTAITAISAMSM